MRECAYIECDKPANGPRAKYCSRLHAEAQHRLSRLERPTFTRGEIARMKSSVSKDGYVNRQVVSGIWVAEHILVMESVLGVRLPPKASVHHKNGVRDDNDPANLELWLSSHPSGQRVKCPHCNWPLITY